MLRLLPLIFWLVLWVYWLISAFRAKKSAPLRKSWWFRTAGIRIAILVIILFAIHFGYGGAFWHSFSGSIVTANGNAWLGALGVILCGAGVAFAIWARIYLGNNWGMPMTLREKPELVTSGPYQFVRHPIYSGFLLAMFGTAFADGTIWFLVMVLAGIYFIYSAKTEEKMMSKQFPNEYPAYVKKTKMLIPFIL